MGKITTRKDGYQVIKVDGKLKYYHRYLAEKYIPNPDNLPCVNHKDGNPSNNNLDNLEWVTYLGNALHARQNNLWGNNIKKRMKLTLEIIEEAKLKYNTGKFTYKKLAQEYGVDYKTIYQAINGKSYNKTYLL
jgi:hypothetical protein